VNNEDLLKPLVSIIIVNWNGRVHLPDCLDSITAQSFRDFEVILVDNGSKDGSAEFVRARYPWVKIISLKENKGFASGNNRGFELAHGDYIVTLNNDTWADPDWLETLVRVTETHPQAGMVGSRICSFYNQDVIDSIGMGICRDGMSRGMFRNRRWSELHLQDIEDIFFPSACVALYRRTMLEETGFFDDDFFAYAEDSDLGLRGRLAGWEAVAATQAVVYHKYSQTAGRLSPFKVYLVERNHYWVVWKNFPLSRIITLPFNSALRYYEQMRYVLTGNGTGGEFQDSDVKGELIRATLKGIIDGLGGIVRMLRRRRQTMKNRQLSMKQYSILLNRYQINFGELLDHD